MAPKKTQAARKRTLSSAGIKGNIIETKKLRTRTPAKANAATKPLTSSAKKGKKAAAVKDEEKSEEEAWDVESDESSDDDAGSDFDEVEDDGGLEDGEDEEDEEDEPSEESDVPTRRRSSGKAAKKTLPIRAAAGAAVEESSTGYGPGVQVVTKKAKARAAGNVRYTDDTVHPNTMLFLADLKANNRRDWLKANDPDYRQSLADWNSFVEKLSERISEIDDTIPELPVKDLIFRIHRDIRFSKDPTPYKAHFSASWSRTGRKGPFGKYYLQIAPGDSFIGGGLWQPENTQMAAMRRAIDRRPNGLKDVLRGARLRRDFFGGVADNEKKVLKAFLEKNAENALKVKPKGYEADHPNIDLIRLKSYIVGCRLGDDFVVGDGGLERVAQKVQSMVPFITYLNSVVMPDGDEDDDDEDENDEDAED